MMLKDMSRSSSLVWLAVSLLFIVVSRVTSLDVAVWSLDEGLTAAIAEVIRAGGIPYLDAVDHRGPATYYVYAAWFWLTGGDGLAKLQSLHVALLIVVAGLAAGVYRLGLAAGGNRVAALSVFWFAFITSNGWSGDVRAFHTEWVLAAGSLCAALLLLKALPTSNRRLIFLSGLMFGFAFTAKQPAVFDLLAAVVLLTFDTLVPVAAPPPLRERVSKLLRCGLSLALGFLLLPCFMAGYLYSHGAWPDFITWFWRYNTELYVPAVSVAERLQSIVAPWSNVLLLDQPMSFVPLAVGLLMGLILLSSSAVTILKRLQALDSAGRVRVYIGLWLLFGWIAANLSGREFGHYLIQLFVPLALISGISVNSLLQWLAKLLAVGEQGVQKPVAALRYDAACVLIAIALMGSVVPAMIRPVNGWPQVAYLDLPSTMPMDLANYLKERTGADDRIWIWGWLSSVYVMAERQPASRFVYCSFLSGLVPWVNLEDTPPLDTEYPGAWDMWEADMQAHPPVYIVDMAVGEMHFWRRYNIDHYPRLKKFIAEQYTEEAVFRVQLPDKQETAPYFRIYRRNGS